MERRFRALAPESCQRGGGEPLRVVAVATRTGRRWGVLLTLRRGELAVTRSLTAGSCAALAEATAVIAATACPALDEPGPSAEAGEASEAAALDEVEVSEAVALDEVEVVPVVDEAVVPARAEAPVVVPVQPDVLATRALPGPVRRGPGLELQARLALAWGPTPAPAALVGAALRLRWPAVELLLALDGGPRRRVDGAGGSGIDVRAALATVAGCPAASLGAGRRPARVSLCLGLEAGALVGTGVGTPVTRTAAQPWLAALVGPSLTWSPGARLGLGVAVDVAASLTRPAFSLEGFDTVFRAPAASVRLRIFLAVRLR